jgi:NAD+ kinase
MKWGLICKPNATHVMKEVKTLHDHLVKLKQPMQVETLLAKALKVKATPLERMAADVYVAVGGDGTILLTLHHTDRPVLAVNAGGIGFLSEVEPKYALNAVERILRGDFRVEERAKVACQLDDQRLPDAANEVTVQSSQIAKLIKFRIEINGEVTDTLRGDGVIVATATGSTGYSLSVGGPILHPSVDAVVVSPIAPFRLGARPLVIPYTSTVRITLLERRLGSEKPAKVVVDGHHSTDMAPNEAVTVTPSERRARFVRFNGGFYDRVRTKLTR